MNSEVRTNRKNALKHLERMEKIKFPSSSSCAHKNKIDWLTRPDVAWWCRDCRSYVRKSNNKVIRAGEYL